MEDCSSGNERDAAFAARKEAVERKLAIARANLGELQEAAFMKVPAHLLDQVEGGAALNFSRILEQMEADNARRLKSLTALLGGFENPALPE